MKKSTLCLCFILMLSCSLKMKAKNIVEKTFSSLKLVTDVSELSESKTYVLIADDGTNMYAVKDADPTGEYASSRLVSVSLTSDSNLKDYAIFFTLKYKTKTTKCDIIGQSTENYYGGNTNISYDNAIFTKEKAKTKFEILKICNASSYYNNALIFTNGSYYITTNGETYKHKKFGLYASYANSSESSTSTDLPALIYEYNAEEKQPLGIISIKTDEGYGTIYTDVAYVMPEGVTGYTVPEANKENWKLTLKEAYSSGETVPANTALVVYGKQGEYPYYAPEASSVRQKINNVQETSSSTNLLYGTTEKMTTPKPDENYEYYFYKLYYLVDTENSKTLGFFGGAEDGAAFTNQANRAYMAIKQDVANNVQGFALPQQQTTGIFTLPQTENAKGENIYNLLGEKMNVDDLHLLPTGIYIYKGKKVLIK